MVLLGEPAVALNDDLAVRRGERLLVVAPHPDDESLGAGGLLDRVVNRNGTADVVLMTAGDGFVEAVVRETYVPRPRPTEYIAYGERRLSEVRAALRELDGQRIRLRFLGFPDGGLDRLLGAHWHSGAPARSHTTQASDPPYQEAVDPNLAYDGTDLRREMARLLGEFRPTLVVIPDVFDRHPDHRASGVFSLLALSDWLDSRTRPRAAMPRILSYVIHWPAWPPGWDDQYPNPDARDAYLGLPVDLPEHGGGSLALRLTDAEVEAKRAALARHATQQEEMASFLAAFVRKSEPFIVLTAKDVARAQRNVDEMRAGVQTAGPAPR